MTVKVRGTAFRDLRDSDAYRPRSRRDRRGSELCRYGSRKVKKWILVWGLMCVVGLGFVRKCGGLFCKL